VTGRLLTREAFFWPAVRPLWRDDDNLVIDISHRFINGRNELFQTGPFSRMAGTSPSVPL
jgi:hypothetical protein